MRDSIRRTGRWNRGVLNHGAGQEGVVGVEGGGGKGGDVRGQSVPYSERGPRGLLAGEGEGRLGVVYHASGGGRAARSCCSKVERGF